jgi:hypothetical protein
MSDPMNTNLPNRINSGETTVHDTKSIAKIFLFILLGGLLIGLGVGLLLGLF